MNRTMLASSDRISVVTLVKGEHRIRLALRLSHEYSGGEIVRFAPDAIVSVQGADEPSTHYTISNWISGVASGALYSFRTLRVPRQCIQITEFVARLRATDMDAVANAGALAIANLVGKELSNIPTDTWEIDIRTESATESRTSATPNAMC